MADLTETYNIIARTIADNIIQYITGDRLHAELVRLGEALNDAKEDGGNKVTSITEESTDEQFPSAKAVYDLFSSILTSIDGYDATKKQVLKNVEGVFQWVDDYSDFN